MPGIKQAFEPEIKAGLGSFPSAIFPIDQSWIAGLLADLFDVGEIFDVGVFFQLGYKSFIFRFELFISQLLPDLL
jgi:hypothetical protein